MSECFDQILCNQSDSCEIFIVDENGLEIETRYLHDGDVIYLQVPERTGYTLTGFTFVPYNGSPYPIIPEYVGNNLYKVSAICGGTFVANFTTNIYELTVVPDSEIHGSTLGSGRYPYGTVVHISANENDGYHFIGWFINDVLISTDIDYDYIISSNSYIVGKFEGDEYSIVARPNNILLGSASGSGVYEYGVVVTLVATPYEGSTFLSWVDGDTNPTKVITVTENNIYIALFQRDTYLVTVVIINASRTRPSETCGIVTGGGIYDYGTVVTLYASPALGFEFISWDNGSEHVDEFTRYSFTITGDTTIYATFNDAMYTLTLYSLPENGGYITNTVTPAVYTGGTYPYNTVVNVQALPFYGYRFDRWGDGALTDVRTFTMTSDITQTAFFNRTIPTYTLKIYFDSSRGNVIIMNGSVNITMNGGSFVYATVNEGTILTAYVSEISPYTFDKWDDSTTEGLIRFFTMNDNITREVYFEDRRCAICICNSLNWKTGYFMAYYSGTSKTLTVNDRCVTVEYGTDVRFEFIPNSSERIDAWDVTGLGDMDYIINGQEITITVTDNGELCATIV